MNQTAIFWPMLAQVLLVYIVYVVMGARRFGAVKSGAARTSQFKDRSAEPAGSLTAANNLANQFELPVLFYVLCLALYATGGVSFVTLILMWLFVISRYVHAFVHVTANRVMLRSRVFVVGWGVLGLAWILFALHLLGLI